MKNHTVNIAIQILPMSIDKPTAYEAIDQAILILQSSGLKYVVCPFETVIEGTYNEIMEVIKKMQDIVLETYSEHIIVNIKIQRSKNADVFIGDKIEKYNS